MKPVPLTPGDRWLWVRALAAFLALPGIVAFGVPLLVLRPAAARWTMSIPSVVFTAAGITGLAACIHEFYRSGRGTLASWDPPRRLVTTGLYRFTRNPMYLSVVGLVIGWATGFGSRGIGVYAAGLAVLFHLRVVWHEEPFLARTHPETWGSYAATVPRWIGRRGRPQRTGREHRA